MGLLKNYYLKTLCSVRALSCITGSGIGALQDSLDPFRKESAYEYSLRIRSVLLGWCLCFSYFQTELWVFISLVMYVVSSKMLGW